MIDHDRRCIFIHQRKAAGSSIITAFGLTPQDEAWHAYNNGVLGKNRDRRPAPLREYFVFSAVRNPFDRLVSGWKYLKPLRHLPLRQVLENPPREGHPYRHFTCSQAALLRGRDGKLVTDDLVRFETCQDDFDRICRKIGKEAAPLPRMTVNLHRQRDCRTYFDDHTIGLAADLFREDLEMFGYSFDGPY